MSQELNDYKVQELTERLDQVENDYVTKEMFDRESEDKQRQLDQNRKNQKKAWGIAIPAFVTIMVAGGKILIEML